MPRYVPGKTLKRCSICGKFHAAYLVDDPRGGQLRLCYDCWKAKVKPQEAPKQTPSAKNDPAK